jgi:hypothetical protein
VLSVVAPLAVLRAVWDKALRWLVLFVVFYTTCWFFSGQIIRYLLPMIPILCVACAVTAHGLARPLTANIKRGIRSAIVPLAALAILGQGIHQMWREVIKRGPIPTTKRATESYIEARVPEYKAVTVTNSDPGRIYGLHTSDCAYYAEDCDVIGDTLGPAAYAKLWSRVENPELFLANLRNLGTKYLMIGYGGEYRLPRDPVFERYLEPIYADQFTEVFRILDSPRLISSERRNLILNPGFDELSNGMPVSWNRRGNPVVGAPDGGAASGRVAVEVSEPDGFQQFVNVTPGKTYQLALEAKAGARGKVFRLQINWSDERTQTCTTSIRLFEATDHWNQYTVWFTAPPCARRAEIFASAHDVHWVWMDNFEFIDTGGSAPAPTPPPPVGVGASPNR